MKIRSLWVAAAVLAAVAVNFRPQPAEAKDPEVYSIVESKALGELRSGTGRIEILLSLQ